MNPDTNDDEKRREDLTITYGSAVGTAMNYLKEIDFLRSKLEAALRTIDELNERSAKTAIHTPRKTR